MKVEGNLEERVERALNSLEHINRATPKPYLLTRINAKASTRARNIWESAATFISKPAVAIIGLCLIILINISVILKNKIQINTLAEHTVTTTVTEDEEYASTFVINENIINP